MAQGRTLAGGWELLFPRYTTDQLFALVSDIESYPGFVPGCIATRILARRGDKWQVDNVFGFGPIRSRFCSRAVVQAPHRLDISSTDGPWERFSLSWRLDPMGEQGCRLACRFDVEFRLSALAGLASLGMPSMERRIISAFEARAGLLYG
jgi:coenzyme Q-binding protein COQ10